RPIDTISFQFETSAKKQRTPPKRGSCSDTMVPDGTVEILEVPVEADLADVSVVSRVVPVPLVSVFGLERQVVGNGEFGANADRHVSASGRVRTNADVGVEQSRAGDEAETAGHITLPGRVRQPGDFTFEAGEQRVVD